MNTTRIVLLAGVLALAPTARAQEPLAEPAADPLAGLDTYVREALVTWGVPGLAIAVVKDDSVVFARGFGVRASGAVDPVDERTLFANASTTKAFTAMAIAMLVDDEVMGWDDRLIDHLPEFALQDAYASREVRLRDLLTHRLGFGDPEHLWYGMETGFGEILRRLRYQEPESSFRSLFAYNNVGYAAAGVAAARAAGTTWDDLIRERILDPLGMEETVTQGRFLGPGANVARPHDVVGDTLLGIEGEMGLVDPIPAAGSMYSSARDMAGWLRFLLAEGVWRGERLVSEGAFAELLKPQELVTLDEFYPTANVTRPWVMGYGLGWFLQDYRGEKIAFHTGSIDGFVAIVGLMPSLELGLVVFANRDHAEIRHALMFRVFDAFLGEPRRDWSAELRVMYDSLAAERDLKRAQARSRRVADTRPSRPPSAYGGTYADSAFGTVEVRLESAGGKPRLVLERSPFLTADLTHWHYDVFDAAWRKRWLKSDLVAFRIDERGEVAALLMWGHTLARVRDEAQGREGARVE